ncbi:MAG: glycosyltransferase family 2 protein [Flavobacteriales bacterium]|nr:glycosyltransferase family 2 protein [Flavobacteriales bacterium]
MKLSVIIVNYNVEFFLEQCLHSVEKAIQGIESEVFVVDNVSVDGSCAMVKEKFPWVMLIENTENVGFSKGNNQAMRIAKGEYVLLLNPDTVVEEDTFSKVVDFMDQHPETGGLGVKMVDGKGNYLPESKRGLPSPWVAFYKIFGLSALFPKSKRFNKYYLGNLSSEETHEIEILSGAFMLMRKKALDKVGLLDEAFFMYGEDIDLSWRIILGGYKNHYYPHTRIIHYKGESTKKGSLNYVFVFYNAMIIFAKKHFDAQHAKVFSFLIKTAIYLRAGLAIINRFLKSAWQPVLDFVLILSGLLFLQDLYADFSAKIYDRNLSIAAFSAYALTWMLSILYSGGYDKPVRISRIFSGIAVGSGLILVAYSLLPEDLRFSRALILLGTLWVSLVFLASRSFMHRVVKGVHRFAGSTIKRYALVGSQEEIERIEHLMQQTRSGMPFRVHVGLGDEAADASDAVGQVNQLDEIIRVHKINEVVFSGKDLEAKTIINHMSTLDHRGLDFKIAPPESLSIIGSNSIDASGDVFILDTNAISKSANKRNKRTLDLFLSALFIVLSPIIIWFQRKPLSFIKNAFQVFFGKKSWVSYADTGTQLRLPKIKKGVVKVDFNFPEQGKSKEVKERLNVVYARNYQVRKDLRLLLSAWRDLGA